MSFLNFSRQGPDIRRDAIAGITVGMVLVPQAMAYASLAGMPPVYGLYAATIPVIIGSLFGHCPILHTGPVAMTSLLTLAALTPLAAVGSAEYIALAALLALLVGAVRLIAGLCKASFLVDFISHPVMTGFSAAAGITIAATQVPKIFGIDPGHHNPVWNSLCAMGDWQHTHIASVIIGIGSLIAMFSIKKYAPRLPNILLVLILATLASWFWGFAQAGGHIIGDIPQGLPSIALPENIWGHTLILIPSAILVAIIGLLEVMAVASAYKSHSGKNTDIDKELIGQGLASSAAACVSGFPVSGSLSRSSLSMISGAQSGLSAVFSAIVIIVTLLWATPLLYHMPMPALAAAIVTAVVALIRIVDFKRCWAISKRDGSVALWTCIATICLAPSMVLGIIAGIGLALIFFTLSMMRPRLTLIDGIQDPPTAHNSATSNATTLHLRHDGRLCFLNARSFTHRVQHLLHKHQKAGNTVNEIRIDCSSINEIDSTAIDHLDTLTSSLSKHNITFTLVNVKAHIQKRFLK